MEELRQMAARIRELREICGFSAEEMAQKLEIPGDLYSAYETDGENVPINILFRMSNIFGVDLNEILTGRAPHLDTFCVVRKGRGLSVDRYPGYRFQSLAHTYKRRMMEPLLVTVEVSEKEAPLVTHAGQEFNLCLEGCLEVVFGEKAVRLEPGDSIYFNPALPHGQRAVDGTAKFLTVIAE